MLRELIVIALALPLAESQTLHPPPYRGVNTQMDGVFVTPVPNAPFSAVVELEDTQLLPDGSSSKRKSIAEIFRDSQGRIHNEARSLMPAVFAGTPRLISIHIYDPATRLNTFLNPYTRIARQNTLSAPLADTSAGMVSNNPLVKREDLGTEFMENLSVHGVHVTRTVPAALNDTGHDIVVTDEYWYSDDLHMNILTKHSDPRTGLQNVAIKQVKRAEPDPAAFQIPAGYKVVDMTPPN